MIKISIKFSLLVFLSATLCLTESCQSKQHKIGTYDNLEKDLKNVENEKIEPHANPEEFEREVNNG